jgi:thymidylate synthase (FAD)
MMTKLMTNIDAVYIDSMGDDLTVVNSARVSFAKEANEMSEQDERLISYLAKHNHWTPFSHPQITLRETVPIFVARQRFKHMVGFTYNEVSRRYVDADPVFHRPEFWRERPEGSVKQGSGGKHSETMHFTSMYEELCRHSVLLYEQMISEGVAPEQARMCLPQSMYTEYYVTGSLAAYARAYIQRIHDGAQKEIQELAMKWDQIISPLFPVSWKCLVEEASAHDV